MAILEKIKNLFKPKPPAWFFVGKRAVKIQPGNPEQFEYMGRTYVLRMIPERGPEWPSAGQGDSLMGYIRSDLLSKYGYD
jgi:hypothetical protein